jgi:hypothetical protein
VLRDVIGACLLQAARQSVENGSLWRQIVANIHFGSSAAILNRYKCEEYVWRKLLAAAPSNLSYTGGILPSRDLR